MEQNNDLQSEIKRCVEYHSSSQCHVSSSSSSSKTNGHPPPTNRSPWRPSSQPIPRYIERGDKFLVSRSPPPSLKGPPDWRRTYRQKMGGKDESRASVAAHYVGAMKALRAAIFGPLSWRRRASKPDVGSRMQHPTPPHPLLSHAVWLLFLLRAGVGVGGGGHSLRKRKALGKHYHFQEGGGEGRGG